VNDAIYLIVEGDGEKEAAPALIRRLLQDYLGRSEFTRFKPLNAHGISNLVPSGGLERFLELTRRVTDCKGVVVLLDAEREHRDCPRDLAVSLATRARELGLPFPVVIVCACCEYESWFLWNLDTDIRNWLNPGASYEGDPETECGAKGWLSRNMPSGHAYKETSDQLQMTFHIDILHTMEKSRSFRRMVHAVEELLAAIDSDVAIVTPMLESNES